MPEFQKIAIIKLSAIGDVVHALPVASALRRRYPGAHLTWIVERKCYQILEGNPVLDQVIIFEKTRWLREFPYPHRTIPVLLDILRFSQRLRRENFDLAIDLQGLLKSGVLTWLTGAKLRIGFSKGYCRESGNTYFTNRQISPSGQDVHVIDQYLSLVRGLGVNTEHKAFNLHIPDEDQEYIDKFLQEKKISRERPLVVINPGAGWETKQWGEDRYAGLADQIILDLGATVIFSWGPSETGMVKSIIKKMQQTAFMACPTTLRQSMALIRRAHLMIAGDTGPLHIASALNTPSVGIYGPSPPERNGPYGQIHQVVQTGVRCRSCFRRFCSSRECMESISVERVMGAARKIMR